jgi:hypothetical protein
MRHDLNRLGEHEFEDLSQALAVAVLGGAVSVFGEGPDGGREASFDGLMAHPTSAAISERWNGYGIVQAKFKRRPTTTKVDTDWFLDQLRKELKEWANDDSGRVKRGRRPEYLLFITNVPLSSDPGRGGVDRASELIGSFAPKIGLRGWAVWHEEQVCRYLDIHDGIRRTYSGLTLAGDVLADLQRVLARLPGDQQPDVSFSSLLTSHAAKELMAQAVGAPWPSRRPDQPQAVAQRCGDRPARSRQADPSAKRLPQSDHRGRDRLRDRGG